ALAGAARHEARRQEATVSHRGLKQFAALICPARDRVRDRGVLVSQTRPAICRTAIPFEPISPLDRNQAAARPFPGDESRRSHRIPNCCCIYGSRSLPDCQHFPWSSALLPRSQCFVPRSVGSSQRLAWGSAELKRFAWAPIGE